MAAASLALQWSPPPSSPLFDEHQQQQHQQGSRSSPSITTLSSPSSQQRPALSSPRPSSGRPSSGSTPGAGGSSVLAGSGAGGPSGSYFSNLPPSASSRNLAAASSPSATSRTPSPRPSTYAAAASSPPIPQQQRNPPQPVPSPSAHPHYHHHHQHQQHPNFSPQPRPYQGQQQYFAQHEQQQHQQQRTPSTDSHESSSSRRDQSAPVGATENGSRIAAPASRSESTRSTSSGLGTGPNGSDSSLPHSRQDSTSSQNSSVYSSAAVSDKASTVGGRSTPTPASAYKKPSPLSRQPVPEREDDNETNASYGGSDRDESLINGRATPTPTTEKKKGFSGKLRKALSLSAVNELQQQQANNASVGSRPSAAPSGREMPTSMSSARMVSGPSTSSTIARPPSPTRSEFGAAASSAASISSRRGPRPPVSNSAGAATSTDGSGKRSLFNRKFNSSTDNISISSTVSSASVMLRKVGNLGKMARRHSLMGLTNMFNKDKEGGRDGLQTDDFGTLTPSASAATISANPKASAGMSRSASGNGKSDPAAASVSHATVELDPNVGDGSMTPAAHYVRQHQIQMRQQAEAEEKAARERQEAEARAAEAAAAAKSRTVLGATQGKTTDDVVESRQKMIEKEKERLKSKRTWRNRLRVGGSSVDLHASAAPTGLETIPATEPKAGTGSDAIAAPPQDVYPTSISAPSMSSHFPQDSISRGVGAESAYLDNDQDLLPPHMPAAGSGHGGEESGDEFETDSLRHWGEGIERSRASAALVKAPKGILKKSASSSQLSRFAGNGSGGDGPVSGAFDRPWTRVRASSYDAPQAAPAPGAPMLSALSTTSEGVDRMDGVARSPSPNAEAQRRPASSGEDDRPAHSPQPPSVPAFGHHSNSSMPTLTMMTNPTTGALPAPSHRPSMQKKRICFTEEHIYHSTWPAHVYDRRGELATCNRLTPLLAQRIKEELNSFKMEEMEVAPSSRIYTHFFV
ncbi:hypothetical protein BCV69DRAFT_133534 [Microstroma glucosiphilum]|uniref:Uncharacterized protein n=1 Tax=Pseudomicrostroma glucosiphilum TaxID=1684307 RepID=A0A316UA93_9BASI|nr:hypothetical protein BCV69DRAFT_133534 [Pseudomicrostroma glucosiphilum]PWN22126.1 hypothetical protein BCV69DRAFT_133534 [Pseudomicrostroma glucosiphilum]